MQIDPLEIFDVASKDGEILGARFDVLTTGSENLLVIADFFQVSGYVQRDDRKLAIALLSRLASELCGGIATLINDQKVYAAGGLLRQFVEIEYIMFIGYQDLAELDVWYNSDPDDIRKNFTPQKMRKKSGGIFSDSEYWMHCEIGGHPHPKARLLLAAYSPAVAPEATLLPDAVHHFRRMWTSLKLIAPRLIENSPELELMIQGVSEKIEVWEALENDQILAWDGIQKPSESKS